MNCFRVVEVFGRAATLLGAFALVTGCALGRGTVDLDTLESSNPYSGPAVKIARISDKRVFQIDPSNPSTPSLMDNQIHNAAITSRAIARKRGGFGAALGDIVLPEGRTVMQVIDEALSRGLRESGYRVLTVDEPGYAEAAPLEVDIHEFWAWFTPGFWAITLQFRTRIDVSGRIAPFEKDQSFDGSATTQSAAALTEDWLKVMKLGLNDLNQDIVSRQLLQSRRAPYVPPYAAEAGRRLAAQPTRPRVLTGPVATLPPPG